MSVSAAIDELKVKRDILLNNAGVLRNEARELLDKEREITEAIRILETYADVGKNTSYGGAIGH